jgi:hypothetical protein
LVHPFNGEGDSSFPYDKGHRYWRLIDVATWQEQNINKSDEPNAAYDIQ